MRLWLSRGNIGFVIVVVLTVVGLLFGLGVLPFGQSQSSMQINTSSRSTIIADENVHLGTSSWQIPYHKGASIEIQAYAQATSVLPGQKLTFYVSTLREGTPYEIEIYRLGWYGGLGGRLMVQQNTQIGHAQGYYDESNHRLVDCKSCLVDFQTGLVEANWKPSYTLIIPSSWVTGVYLAKFTESSGLQTYVPFDVRGNVFSSYVAVTSDTTYAAYNDWGGYSLYRAYNSVGTGRLGKGVKVSFDRPYAQGYGSGFVLSYEIDAIRWLERQGYDLSYISSVDLHEDPVQLLQHRAYLSLGHDEYWTKEMRDGVEHARDLGVGLAFLGANAAYWQMRFEPDSAGTANRTIVCYKVETENHDLERDPLYGKDNTHVTTQWRDPVLNRPENALIGIMYSSLTDSQKLLGFPWKVNPLANSRLLNGTGLQAGQQYGCDLVGYEWDRIFNNGVTPGGLQVLGVSITVSETNTTDISNTTYYIAPSGALVFATGSIFWTSALDTYRASEDQKCIDQDRVVPGIQKLMANVMDALIINHAAHN